MAAFIDDDMNNLHLNTSVFLASFLKFDGYPVIPKLLLQVLKDLSQVLMAWDLHVTKLHF